METVVIVMGTLAITASVGVLVLSILSYRAAVRRARAEPLGEFFRQTVAVIAAERERAKREGK